VIGFVLLAYGLAWAVWVALLGPTIKEALQEGRTPEHFTATAAVTLGMYAPALAAVLMRLFVSKEGLRRALGPLPSLKIGLAAVLLPLALVLILVATVTMINIGEPTPGKPMGSLLAILTFVGVPIGTLLAFGEEFGWRGYLLPQLLPLGEVKAALIVGLIWGPWHLPVLIVGLNYPGQPIIAVLAVFLLSATLLSFLHTRFYVASGYSLIAVALLHGSLNTFSDRLTDPEHLSGNPLIVSAGGVIASALVAVGIFITYRVLARRTSS
jgi:membrane protease YdiL (CAAX protease family)